MAFNELIADRVRRLLVEMNVEEITEKKMFGGLSFLYHNKMAIGVVGTDLAVRIVQSKFNDWIERPHVRPMDFTKRPMKEFLFVEPHGFVKDQDLKLLIELGLEHAVSKL